MLTRRNLIAAASALAMLAAGGRVQTHEARRQSAMPDVFDRWMKHYAGNGGTRTP